MKKASAVQRQSLMFINEQQQYCAVTGGANELCGELKALSQRLYILSGTKPRPVDQHRDAQTGAFSGSVSKMDVGVAERFRWNAEFFCDGTEAVTVPHNIVMHRLA